MRAELIVFGTCPLCKGRVTEEDATTFDTMHPGYHVADEPLPVKPRETRVAACSSCEFLIDLRHPNGRSKSSAELLLEIGSWLS